MKRNSPTLSWLIACASEESLRQAEQLARQESDPDKIFVDVAVAFPNGAEERTTVHHRLGDYFDRVQVLSDDSPDLKTLTLVFHMRLGAKRYWKDLMVGILRSIEESVAGTSVEFVEKTAN